MIKKYFFEVFNLDREKIIYLTLVSFEKIFLLISGILFVNVFSKDLYGLYGQLNFYSGIFFNTILLGMLIPIVIKSNKKEVDYSAIITSIRPFFNLVFIFICCLLILTKNHFFFRISGSYHYSNFIYPFLILIFSDLYSEILIQELRTKNKLIKYSLFILFRSFIKIISLFIIYLITESFLISFSITVVLYMLYIILLNQTKIYFSWDKLKKSFVEVRVYLNKGLNMLGMYLLGIASLSIINLLITNQFDLSILAVYNFNLTIASISITFISFILFYSLPEYASENSNSIFTKKYLKNLSLCVFILLVIFLLSVVFYENLIKIFVIDQEYSNIKLFSLIYLMNSIIVINNFLSIPFYKKEKYNLVLIILGFSTLINILFIYVQKNHLNLYTPIYGGIISYSLSLILIASIFLFYNYKKKIANSLRTSSIYWKYRHIFKKDIWELYSDPSFKKNHRNEFLKNFITSNKIKIVFDFGCASGNNYFNINNLIDSYYGIDISQAALKVFKKKGTSNVVLSSKVDIDSIDDFLSKNNQDHFDLAIYDRVLYLINDNEFELHIEKLSKKFKFILIDDFFSKEEKMDSDYKTRDYTTIFKYHEVLEIKDTFYDKPNQFFFNNAKLILLKSKK